MKLAIDGGTPVFPQGPPAWPLADEQVHAALVAAYHDGSWGRYEGPNLARLTERLGQRHEGAHAWCCSSGTAAVELALRGLRVGEGDQVLLAAYDYPGNFRCIEAVGARPVLVDIQPGSWVLDVQHLEQAHSPDVRAVIVSHLHGGVAAMSEIRSWADQRNVAIIEDACQATGARIDGRTAGTWGNAGVISFGGSKLLTAGRGGAVLTHRDDVLQRIKIFCQRGSNAFPLSELQAAELLPQLVLLDPRNKRRLQNARFLVEACRQFPGITPVRISDRQSPAFYKLGFDVTIHEERSGASRDAFTRAVRAEGVALDAGFSGFVRRSSRRCRRAGDLVGARQAAERTVVLHHPVLLENQETMQRVADAIGKVLQGLKTAI